MDFRTPIPGYTVMDIPERDALMKAFNAFDKNKAGQQEQDNLFLC